MSDPYFPSVSAVGGWLVRIGPRAALGALISFVLAAIPWTYLNIKFGRQLEAELAALKAQGKPVTMTDAIPEPVPDNENAATVYQTVFGVSFDPIGRGADAPLAKLDDVLERKASGPIELAPRARQLLSTPEARKVLETLREASERPHSVFPVNWEDGFAALFPHLAKYRTAARVLWAQALISAQDGRTEEALAWCLVALRMSEHAFAEPSLIAHFVGYGMHGVTFNGVRDIVSTASIRPAVAAEFEEYLGRIDLNARFGAAMDAERGMVCDLYGLLRTEPAEVCAVLEIRRSIPARVYFGWPGRPLHKLDQLIYLESAERYDQLFEQPYRDAAVGFDALKEELSRPVRFYQAPTRGVVADMFIPAYGNAVRKRDWAAAEIGLCRVVMALKAYKYTHQAYPATLDQLQGTLDYRLPEDPFSGKDFVYQPQGEGFKLYSLGVDLDDDGGVTRHYERRDFDDSDIVWECAG